MPAFGPQDKGPNQGPGDGYEFDPHLIVCSGAMVCNLMSQALHQKTSDISVEAPATIPVLTAKETQILVLLQRGMRNNDIALHFGVATRTVKGYFTTLLAKFEVSDRTALLGAAVERGLVPRAQTTQARASVASNHA